MKYFKLLVAVFAAYVSLFGAILQATPLDVSTPRFGVPPNIVTNSNRPMLMLAASKDHTLFGPVYTDYEDLEGDGNINTTFSPGFEYYGYFDPKKCYLYQNSRFEPSAYATFAGAATTAVNGGSINETTFTVTSHGSGTFTEGMAITWDGAPTNIYIVEQLSGTAGGAGTYRLNTEVDEVSSATIYGVSSKYTCGGSGQWSGNFLNWATTSRLDVVRKMLYGGKRSTDEAGLTVLERANLSQDSHSFTKYYPGADIRNYTPFSAADLGNKGLTICNRSDTKGEGGNPMMRLAKGNFRLWSTVEGVVCNWSGNNFGDKTNTQFSAADAGRGVFVHPSGSPTSGTHGATYSGNGPDLIVRVKVCDPAFLSDKERCQAFPPDSTTAYKPYGLFQEFGFSQTSGSAARAEFGVITGSYDKNLTAGALRKNMGDFADEINTSTGVFCHATSSGCSSTTSDGRTTGNGAIKAFDSIVLYGASSGNYTGSNVQLPSEMADGTLSAWGNPVGEMVVQALQYYAGNASSNPTSTTNDSAKGLPVLAWTDPLSNSNTTRKGLYGNSICRPMYVMALSSSATSFDGQADTPFATLPNRASGTLASYTNIVGAAEGLNSSTRSVGSVSGGFGETCAAKTIGNLSDVSGICPDAPGVGGTYQVAGAALYGNTSKIRTITTPPLDLGTVQDALKVKTMAASLSGGSSRIEIRIPTKPPAAPKYVYITPEGLWASNSNAKKMPGALLTFNSIYSTLTTANYTTYPTTGYAANATVQTGTFVVTWNDSLFGGDYDMDITGLIRFDVIAPPSGQTAFRLKVTTDIWNVGAGWTGSHGFSIIGVTKEDGTDANGRYLTHRHLTSDSIMSGSTGYLCANTDYRAGGYTHTLGTANNTATLFNGIHAVAAGLRHCDTSSAWNVARTDAYLVKSHFLMVGAQNVILNDPLWYAAKYGSFASSTKNANGTYTEVALPASTEAWDRLSVNNIDGSVLTGSDGIPDGYFLARKPNILEEQLRTALEAIAKNSNAAPAVSSSQLISEGLKYVAKFDSTTVDGNIEAYKVDRLGYFEPNPSWRAGQLLRARASRIPDGDRGESRQIITNFGNATGGVSFRWSSLPSGYQTQMTTSSTNRLSTTNAGYVVDYMRGDQRKEAAVTGLRVRGDNLMGPVINATPWIQDRPIANFSESNFPGYRAFAIANKARDKLLWVSANDGMLHAFNPKADTAADGGSEVFAFVPGVLANRLAEIPLQRGTTGRTRLNNANFTSDASETQPQGTVWPYVDGSPFTGDVCNPCTGTPAWKTYAFTSLGRGAKALVALDVTNVSNLAVAETNGLASSIFKWQFTSDDDSDLGYIVNDVSTNAASGQAAPIVKLNNGKFAIAVGNGQKSTNGKAALFLLFVEGPISANWTGQYVKIIAEAGPNNGLSAPNWIDTDGNGTADYLYAGDLKGNMWKFDVSSNTPGDWGIAYKSGTVNKPLVTAKDGANALAITTAPEIMFPPFDGQVIAFGTGNAFESTDFPNAGRVQKIYGVWDRPDFAVSGGRALPTDLTTLVSRTYQRQTSGAVNVIVADAIDWTTKDGWYFSLPDSSEMVLSDPVMRAGVLTFTSVRPKAAGLDVCSDTPNVALYAIDPITGKAEKNLLGTTVTTTTEIVNGSPTTVEKTLLNSGKEILDQKVRTVNDRTMRDFTLECRSGDANCHCEGTICNKTVSCQSGAPGCTCTTVAGVETCWAYATTATCLPGQSSMRVIGQGTDATLCYNANARVQWREIPGLRTDR